MPGFANDDTQEVNSPYSYVNQDPAAQLSSNYNGGGSVGYGGGYQSSPGSGNANPVGYSNGPGSGTKNADTSGSSTKAPSSSMVDSMSAGYDRSSGAYAWGPGGQFKSTPPPSVYDQNRAVDIRVATKKSEVKPYQQALASMISPETGKPYYQGKIDGRPGSMTGTAVLQFQKDYNLYQDGLIGIAPHGETGPTINEVFSDQIKPPMATARNRAVTSEPLSPLEAAAPAPVAPVVSPLDTVRTKAAAEPAEVPTFNGQPIGGELSGVVPLNVPGAPTRDFSIADPGPATRIQEGAGVVPLPDYAARPKPPAYAEQKRSWAVAGGFGQQRTEPLSDHEDAIKAIIAPYAGTRGKAAASRFSPGGSQAAMGNIASRAEAAPAAPPVAAAPNYVITPHSLNSGVARGAPVPAPPVSPLEAAAPPSPADRYTSELQKLRQTYGLQPGDNVGPGEQPPAPPTEQEAGFLKTAKESIASGRYEPGPRAEGIGPITRGAVSASPAEASVNPTSSLEAAAPFNVGAGIQPGAATNVLRIMGIMPKGEDRLPGGEAQPNVNPADPYIEQIQPPLREGRPVVQAPAASDEAHAANVKQVSDMMANQPPEKQREIADHVLIFAHAASLVADAPPEKRAEAFDQQLTRLRGIGAINDQTYQKLHGTNPTDAQLRQMIDLGNAVHEMQGGPQSSLEGARGVQVASADGGALPGRPLQRAAAPNRAMGAPPNIWGESEDPMLDRAIDVPANPDYHYYPEPFYGGRRGGRAAV